MKLAFSLVFAFSSHAFPHHSPTALDHELVSRDGGSATGGNCSSSSIADNSTMIPVPNFGFIGFSGISCSGMATQIPIYPDVGGNVSTPKVLYYSDSKAVGDFLSYIVTGEPVGQLDFSCYGEEHLHNGQDTAWLCGTYLYTPNITGTMGQCINVDGDKIGTKCAPQCIRISDWSNYCLNEPEYGGTYGGPNRRSPHPIHGSNEEPEPDIEMKETPPRAGRRMAESVRGDANSLSSRTSLEDSLQVEELVA